MIPMRYHVISLAAVLIALATGILVGSTDVSHRMVSALTDDKDDLQTQVDELRSQQQQLRGQLDNREAFSSAVGPLAVRGVLTGRSIVLVTTADVVPADRDAVTGLLKQAGATVTGELALTGEFTDPSRADQLRDLAARLLPTGAQLPVASDPGTLAGGLLGALLLVDKHTGRAQATPDETVAALSGLTAGGFIRAGHQVRPAQLAVVLTGSQQPDDRAGDRANVIARLAAALDRAGAGTVLAGRSASGSGTRRGDSGPVSVLRSDPAGSSIVSSVDDVETASGRVATVLALREQVDGKVGRYGGAANAQSPVPGGIVP